MPPRQMHENLDARCSPLLSASAGMTWSTNSGLLGWAALHDASGMPQQCFQFLPCLWYSSLGYAERDVLL